jgi:hypothetical protein
VKKFKKSLPLAEISAYVVCSRPDLMFSLLQFLQLLTTQTIPKGSCTKNLFPRKLEFQYLVGIQIASKSATQKGLGHVHLSGQI